VAHKHKPIGGAARCWNCGAAFRRDESLCYTCGAARISSARREATSAPASSHGYQPAGLDTLSEPASDRGVACEVDGPDANEPPEEERPGGEWWRVDPTFELPARISYSRPQSRLPDREAARLLGKDMPRPLTLRLRWFFSSLMFALLGGLIGAGIWFEIVTLMHIDVGPFSMLMGYLIGKGAVIGGMRRAPAARLLAVVVTAGGWTLCTWLFLQRNVPFTPLDLIFFVLSVLASLLPAWSD